MKTLVLSIIAIATVAVIIACTPNVYAICTIGSNGARLCAGSDFNASMEKPNYENTEFPVILMSGSPDKTLSLKILDTSAQQKLADTIKIGHNGTVRYSFDVTSYSYGTYRALISDGTSTIDLSFAIGQIPSHRPSVSTVAQNADMATLLIYTNVPWEGTIGTQSNSTILSSISANTKYSFACNYNDTYLITLQSAGRTGRGMGIWTVANLIEDGKMLDIGVNRLANGKINMSGQCHTEQFPLSNTGMVSFTTDKAIYQYGDPIQISGIILPDLQRNYVLSSTIFNSDGMLIRKDSTGFGNLNTFYFYIPAYGGLWKPGNYRILVEIGKSVAQTDIAISPAQKQTNLKPENHIPVWIKNTVKWWAEGKTSDNEFRQAIQYLIQQRILKIPYYYSVTLSNQSINSWMKASTSMWADGKMSDDEFVNVLKYLNFRE